jgi:glycerol-3-phosphate dehydrogenase
VDIGIVGGGINGLCCVWQLAKQGHQVQLYERDILMNATSRASSKLLHGRLINVAGPWAHRLSQISGLDSPHELVRGSHLILVQPCKRAYLQEAPDDRRIFFVLPWQGNTLVGTPEVRHTLNAFIACTPEKQSYLLNAWSQHFSDIQPNVINSFAVAFVPCCAVPKIQTRPPANMPSTAQASLSPYWAASGPPPWRRPTKSATPFIEKP